MDSNFSDDGSEYRFFDAQECIASVSDLDSGSHHHHSLSGVENWDSNNFNYDVWMRSPRSVRERRSKFLRWMGLNSDMVPGGGDSVDLVGGDEDSFGEQIDRVTENSGAVLRNSIFEDEFSSSRSTGSSWSTSASSSARKLGSNENFIGRCCNSDGAREFNNDDVEEDCNLTEHQVLGDSSLQRDEQFKDSSAPSSQEFVQRDIPVDGHTAKIVERLKNRWLQRIRSMSCISLQHEMAEQFGTTNGSSSVPVRVQRVKVRQNKKEIKELSALFKGQDILAHEGAILTMKFSLDGQYLASAGEDGIVRVWKVVEDERTNETDLPDIDPSCLYFTVNNLSELAPLVADKEKIGKTRILRNTPDSACIIFPPKVFRILEQPLHVFRGHTGEILDLSWSQNNVSSL